MDVILDILGSILGPIFDHFGVMKMMMMMMMMMMTMMMFMSDVTKPEMANRILRAAALAEGLYNKCKKSKNATRAVSVHLSAAR